MTTIAYRYGVLAVDRQMTCCGNETRTDKKITLISTRNCPITGIGIVVAGDLANAYAFVDWYGEQLTSGGKLLRDKKIDFPFPGEKEGFSAIVVRKLKEVNEANSLLEVQFWNKGMYPFSMNDDDYMAYGSGGDLALGAMHAGASAEKSIRASNHHTIYSGLGVAWINFNNDVPKICFED